MEYHNLEIGQVYEAHDKVELYLVVSLEKNRYKLECIYSKYPRVIGYIWRTDYLLKRYYTLIS
jgi:hypothetical protein